MTSTPGVAITAEQYLVAYLKNRRVERCKCDQCDQCGGSEANAEAETGGLRSVQCSLGGAALMSWYL